MLKLDPKGRTVELLQPGMQLDLGGIAKGYAGDEAQAQRVPHASALATELGAASPNADKIKVALESLKQNWPAKEQALEAASRKLMVDLGLLQAPPAAKPEAAPAPAAAAPAEIDGQPVGYAYASTYRARPGYRFTVENSVYVDPARQGLGIGKAMLPVLIERCEALGFRLMVAVIGDSQNLGSIGVHRTLGFEQTGLMKSAGWKFGKWLDVVLMQRQLGQGDTSSPTGTAAATSNAAAMAMAELFIVMSPEFLS